MTVAQNAYAAALAPIFRAHEVPEDDGRGWYPVRNEEGRLVAMAAQELQPEQ